MLKGKKIILALTGSIAAYKTPELVRQLVKAGAAVKVLMTKSAADFVSPLSLSTVSKHPVHSDVSNGAAWNNHVELGLWADAMVIAPCSANTLAKLANGLCDNLVTAVYLSARCKVYIAPAMDADMWLHPATKANIEKIKTFGNTIIPVSHGELASGLIGDGRMAEPAEICELLAAKLSGEKQTLHGINALVTAGPTYERLDPVRFIGNFSTGKMGIAIAEELHERGANVTLVLGPTQLRPQQSSIKLVLVESAAEMHAACTSIWPDQQLAVMAAAVADYSPATVAAEKIKKKDTELSLALQKTKDILKSLGDTKIDSQLLMGFALETENEEANALGKLQNKKADFIVLNSLKDSGAGFGTDTNKVTILAANGDKQVLPLMEKTAVAAKLVDTLQAALAALTK